MKILYLSRLCILLLFPNMAIYCSKSFTPNQITKTIQQNKAQSQQSNNKPDWLATLEIIAPYNKHAQQHSTKLRHVDKSKKNFNTATNVNPDRKIKKG
jgi:hypothetical protein